MIAETVKPTGKGITAYHALSSFEKNLVQLTSIVYEPVSRITLVNCLRRAGIAGSEGEWFTASSISPVLKKLKDLELLDRDNRCSQEIVELASREAVANDLFRAMADAVQGELPFSQYQVKWPQKCWRAMREFRIGLYSNDIVHMENMHILLAKQCKDEVVRRFPAVQFCNNPFEPGWMRTLAPSLQYYILSQMINSSLYYLTCPDESLNYLKSAETLQTIPPEERLPFHRLLASMLLWQGNLTEAEALTREYPESFIAGGMHGSIEFLLGNNEKALLQFERDLQALRKISAKRSIFFPGSSGLFFLLALFKKGDMNSFGRIRKFIATVRTQQTGNMLLNAYEMLESFLLAQESGAADLSLDSPVVPSNSITIIFRALAKFWLSGTLQGNDAPQGDELNAVKILWRRARDNGYQWIAMVLAELIGNVEGDKKFCDFADDISRRTKMAPVVEAVILEDPWKRRLKALLSFTSDSEQALEATTVPHSRLVWLIGHKNNTITLTGREQRFSKEKGWSRGRPIALSRLFSGRNLEFMTEADCRVCKALKREQSNQNVTYHFNLNHALPALVGHPLLFLEESPEVSVEFIKGEPELLVEKSEEGVRLKLIRDFSQEGVSVLCETPTRFKIIEVTKKHKDIARIISPNGLQIPLSHLGKVMAAVGNLSSFMTVHSAIAVDTEAINTLAGKGSNLKSVAASPMLYLQLIPVGEGFRLTLMVKPFGPQGPCLKPGQGVENIMAEVEGERLQTRRNLSLEEEMGRAVINECPSLAMYEETNWEWMLLETEVCLDVLLELREIMDKVIIEWPEGQRLAVRHIASLDKLSLQLRKKNNSSGLSWFSMTGAVAVDESQVIELRKFVDWAAKNPGRFLPLGKGEFLALTDDFRRRLDDISSFAELKNTQDGSERSIYIHPLAAMAMESITEGITRLEVDTNWKEQLQLIREAQQMNPGVPSTLQAELRDYQVEGYKWLSRLAHWGGGACLADDMGLGKTLQALAIILEKTSRGPCLVVAPTSVCMNWLQEANRFAPTLTVHVLGNRNRRKLVQSLKEFDILVTSYTLLQQEAKLLAAIDWQIIVLDEAQAIKNMDTKRSRAAMSLNGRFKLLTTGTPIENHLGELWNLFNFIIPGLLGSLESFNQRFAIPIERFNDLAARRKLKKLIQPFILRRSKVQVLEELPPRTEITLQVEMTRDELAFYEAIRRQALENLAGDLPGSKRQGKKTRNFSPARNIVKGYTVKILAEIMRLRRACCNPKLVIPDCDIQSSKLVLFEKVVEELLENRHKALVFSQFVGHLQIIRSLLDQKKILYRYLDGATPVKKREKEVEAFQKGDGDLFLISLKAGGLGLNLTAADYVIHMDPWWNPAVEDQAADRAHRIGQVRPVTIYRLITKNTIEEKIVRLHQEKRDLANSLLAETDISTRISVEELLNLIREQ